jgi:hypothetical protein
LRRQSSLLKRQGSISKRLRNRFDGAHGIDRSGAPCKPNVAHAGRQGRRLGGLKNGLEKSVPWRRDLHHRRSLRRAVPRTGGKRARKIGLESEDRGKRSGFCRRGGTRDLRTYREPHLKANPKRIAMPFMPGAEPLAEQANEIHSHVAGLIDVETLRAGPES